MSNRSSAARYARALLDVSQKEGDPQAVEQDLSGFVALVDGHETLGRALVNPAIPAARKSALVAELLSRVTVGPIVRKLLLMLAERDRLVLLPGLLDEYQRRLLDLQNVVRAEVVTAVPLPADRLSSIEQAIAQRTGRRVAMTTRVDASIIGGVVTRIGSVIYDGSVRRQLEKMKETLTA